MSKSQPLSITHPELAKQAHGWDASTVTAGSDFKREWICELGHVWKSTISHRTGRRGCPTCAKSGYDPNSDGYIYFLKHPVWELLQIGITNFPDDRLSTHKRLGWELIELRGPMNGDLAKQWESDILRMLRRHGAKLGPEEVAGKFDGFTEAWLRESMPITSLKELMDLVRKDEDQ